MALITDEERKNLSDQGRRLHNIVRTGTVTETDYAKGKVRVQIGDNLTGWIDIAQMRAGGMNVWAPPSQGEQVVLLAESGDLANAVVMASLNSNEHPNAGNTGSKPRITFDDGTFIEVERSGGIMVINVSSQCRLSAPKTIIEGGQVHLAGEGGPAVARVGDPCTCGGKISQGSSQVFAN